ncbi:MAG: nucleotidyltransferase family protein [Clostridiales Family XIII bacterium]|jgi:D-glycero-alpha-D-manno-heptose 1-phosphate guanylyltransferase|nr:nucleotidyltransferase family protein [Clostridiales Family XIII bacterium]
MMEAIILAGGRGTRLQSAVPDLPKPLAPIAGAPFLSYLLKYLERCKITCFVLSVGYGSEAIIRSFGDAFNGIPILYAPEDTPLGTGGAIRRALSECAESSVFVLNGDSYLGADLEALARLHALQNADISVALKEMSNFARYGAVDLKDGRITAFREKARTARGYINGGVYRVKRDVFAGFDPPEKFSFEDFLAQNTGNLKLCGLPADGDFIDIGIPEDYAAAQSLLPRWVRL